MTDAKEVEEFSDPLVQLDDNRNLNYYNLAGVIASQVLEELVGMCKSDTLVYDICERGDKLILEEVDKLHKKLKNKGIAFPTCVSLNNVAGHECPVSIEKSERIKDGDLVKIEFGVQMNGFPASVAYTVVVNESGSVINDKRSNVVRAVSEASKEVFKLMKIGKTNLDVVKAIEKCATKYNCQLPQVMENMHAPGVISYQMSRGVIDGYNEDDDEYVHSIILNRESENYDFTLSEAEFQENEVYGVDILMCSGTGKLVKDGDVTVYKRLQDKKCLLKLKAARETLNMFEKNRFPISSRGHNVRFKLGLRECVSKDIVEEYPRLVEKAGEYTARIKFTVVVRKKPLLIIGRSSDEQVNKLG